MLYYVGKHYKCLHSSSHPLLGVATKKYYESSLRSLIFQHGHSMERHNILEEYHSLKTQHWEQLLDPCATKKILKKSHILLNILARKPHTWSIPCNNFMENN